jgi:hypothetical protein
MKSILPTIFIILALTGAIVYSLAKRSLPNKPVDSIGTSANKISTITPTPTRTITPTITIIVPEITDKVVTTKGGLTDVAKTNIVKTTITKTTICTPVYGSADTCTEHVVVDTGAENALFFNFAGLAYIGGLLSFVKAKTLKK